MFVEEIDTTFPYQSTRWDLTDGDKDKEATFYVLKHTNMPAILTGSFFFDNKIEGKRMMFEEVQDQIAQEHVNAILKIEGHDKRY